MSEAFVRRVKEIISDQLEVSLAQVTLEASLDDDLGADSLAIVEMNLALEQEFEFEIPDEACEKVKTVGDVIAYVRAHAKA